MEKKLGNTERDFLQAKHNAELMANSLLKKYKWMKTIKFLGDVEFHPGRSKASVERDSKLGREFSFGLNMELIYLDLKNQEKKVEIMFRFKEKPFRDVFFKSYKKNPTTEDLVEQLKNTLIILGSGNTPDDPKAYVIAKISSYPKLCFTPQYDKGKLVKFRIAFTQWSKFIAVNQISIFGTSLVDEAFERMRQ